jgi:hypothetical protein
VRDDLAVALRPVLVLPLEALFQRLMVVYLPIHRHDNILRLVVQRLVSGRRVDDCKPLMRQKVAPAVVDTTPVWAAVAQPERTRKQVYTGFPKVFQQVFTTSSRTREIYSGVVLEGLTCLLQGFTEPFDGTD